MHDSLSTLGICPDPQAVHVIPELSSTSQFVILPGNKWLHCSNFLGERTSEFFLQLQYQTICIVPC